MEAVPLSPDHGKCSTHLVYLLTCRQYEELLAATNRECELCGFPAERMPQKRLYIDHCYQGFWAVRGLLCIRCNSSLSYASKPVGAAAYLANAWFLRMYNERGISPDPSFKTPAGSVVVDPTGTLWSPTRNRDWRSDRGGRARTWRHIFRRYGPSGLWAVDRALLVPDHADGVPARDHL